MRKLSDLTVNEDLIILINSDWYFMDGRRIIRETTLEKDDFITEQCTLDFDSEVSFICLAETWDQVSVAAITYYCSDLIIKVNVEPAKGTCPDTFVGYFVNNKRKPNWYTYGHFLGDEIKPILQQLLNLL